VAEIISLNRARKARDKADAKMQAVENRAKFGRTKGEKSADRAIADAMRRELDGHALTRKPD
jgi:hypothetical protein